MLVLAGNSLGERQKELNTKVNEAVLKNTNFDDVKTQVENADVDRLFKIELASKYKNVEYILDVLKCGDSLYISRALKCIWLYNDEHSNVINTDYLHNNVFPFMSMKMKKKLLVTISMYVKNERVMPFYTYCRNAKLENIATKFLIFAPESFKLAIIYEKQTQRMLQNTGKEYVKQFVGNSFKLAESYLKTIEYRRMYVLHQLRYLYSVSDVSYLELNEKYYTTDQTQNTKLGLRISKDVMTKHKERVRKNPCHYLRLLNKTMLIKHSSSDDAKLYIEALLPPKCSTFWAKNFYGTHKHIIDLIPFVERLRFLKNKFTDKFPGEEFEMSINFYNSKYYNLMTTEEKEAWALRHIESGKELLGSGRDFMWYRFVNFEKAFAAIKKIIMITKDADSRAEVVTVLVECAKSDQDLEKLFNYYYERHVNEKKHHKERFIDKVIRGHNVYEFGESCWTAFNKLFYSLEIYSDLGHNSYKTEYSMIALIYNIIHGKDVPKSLKKYIDSGIYFYLFKSQTNKLSKEKEEIVYQFMLQFYLDSFNSILSASDNGKDENNEKERIGKYINYVLDLMSQYNKRKEDIPDIIKKYMMLDWEEFKNHTLFWQEQPKFTQDILLRHLKENTGLVVSKLPQLEEKLKDIHCTLKLTKLVRKLKVYFSHDVAKVFTDFFINLLSECNSLSHNIIKAAVYGIFELADETFKIEFMAKHVPTEPKIDHSTIDRKLLYIQEAICRLACYSRPPVPLSHMLSYIKGDYVHFCLPMFNSYLAKLPLPLCIEFTKSIIDAPLSIQKHGLRLAFQCFSSEELTKLILDIWKKTKNVSLRSVIYKALYNKILKGDECVQNTLFEVLNKLTIDLYEDDCDDVFSLIMSNDLPNTLITDYLETVWKMINKSTQKQVHMAYRTTVIRSITNKIGLLRKDFLESIIDDHLKTVLDEKQFGEGESNTALSEAKWQLIANYLLYYTDREDSEKKVALAQSILHKCIKMWNKVNEGKIYVARKLCYQFINNLETVCYNYGVDGMAQGNSIFEQILKDLRDALPLQEIYETVWDLQLSIISRKILIESKPKITLDCDDVVLKVIEEGVKDFGKQFANLLNECIEKRIYYSYFFQDINSILDKRTKQLLKYLKPYNIRTLSIGDAEVLICIELLEFNLLETYMFALKTLPNEYNDTERYFENYKSVISKIKQCKNSEIQTFMYKKFRDFKYREYL